MLDVANRHVELLQEEIAKKKQEIEQLQSLVAAIKGVEAPTRRRGRRVGRPRGKAAAKGKTAVRAKGKRKVAAKKTAAATPTRKARRGSYVASAVRVLRKAGGPMRMTDLIKELMKGRTGTGKYADSAARQAIGKAADTEGSPIIRIGPKGSGMYGVAG